MLCKVNDLKGCTLNTPDGEMGEAQQFYFDDQHWAIRYLVANTGSWLSGRLVLISPYALLALHPEERHISVGLTKQQVEDSPSLASDEPVSRQFEEAYYGHYGWPMYWGGPYMWGAYPSIVHDREKWLAEKQLEHHWDPHLRSTEEVSGYHVQASDGELGHVEDFIIDDDSWAIRYLVINTGNWWAGKKVLVSPNWIEQISWSERTVVFNVSRASIQQAPEYTEEAMVTRDYEDRLHRHYVRQGYWAEDHAAKTLTQSANNS